MINMPIVVLCPTCNTKLSAPDTAAGKKVRCPRVNCGRVVAVPPPPMRADFEVVEVEPGFEVVEDKPGFEVVEDESPYEMVEDKPARTGTKKKRRQEDESVPGRERETEDSPSRQFDPKVYSPDGGYNAIGIPILQVALCLASVFMGGAASLIGQFFYLILLFPLLISLGIAAVGYFIVHLTKMRNVLIAGVLGLASGIVAMVSVHFFDYQWFLLGREFAMEEVRQLENIPARERTAEDIAELQSLRETKDVNSFGSFLHFQATQGVTIGKIGRKGTNLGFWGTWIYWFLELIWVAIMTTVGLVLGSKRPFCTDCETWKKERYLGTLQIDEYDPVEVLKDGKVDELKNYDPAETGGNVILTAYVCPNCRSDAPIVIKVEELKVKDEKKGETEKKVLVKLVFPGEALAAFKALFGIEPKPVKKRRRDD